MPMTFTSNISTCRDLSSDGIDNNQFFFHFQLVEVGIHSSLTIIINLTSCLLYILRICGRASASRRYRTTTTSVKICKLGNIDDESVTSQEVAWKYVAEM